MDGLKAVNVKGTSHLIDHETNHHPFTNGSLSCHFFKNKFEILCHDTLKAQNKTKNTLKALPVTRHSANGRVPRMLVAWGLSQ